VDAVKAAFTMPAGAITNATGTHPFELKWRAPLVVRAKTGNATVAGERVSWVVGHVESGNLGWVFAARVRGGSDLPGQAGANLALRTLNARPPT
jgi:beta-lactamase class D